MGIPKKRSRKLELHGRKYRYIVKETTIMDHNDQKELSITVQEDTENPGRPMQFRYPYGIEVGPGLVGVVVNDALLRGWDPSERGAVFFHQFVKETFESEEASTSPDTIEEDVRGE